MELKNLDPILHSQLRLGIISILIKDREADFSFLKDKTGATSGNLSVQINKLKEAAYIDVIKQFKDNYPLTMCRVTSKGEAAFNNYVEAIQSYINQRKG